ncbi:hypothetical protein HPB51_008034 [Rhipicephalus microplus]|uniref:Uncharacterized protein n=1 Tax=Rhipicephalus microplus TaxID=6941 RepID=A0A9J6ERF7_RHIMP|nr:hypothetical protein HPB51_008034 [Rhipicephalus microplus]
MKGNMRARGLCSTVVAYSSVSRRITKARSFSAAWAVCQPVDCLRTALITAGAALEHEAPEQLAALMRDVQAALETQRLPIHSQHVLQELLELKASGWQMNESEKAYGSPTSR